MDHTDHDLLIRIDERTARLAEVFTSNARDHERRLRRLERGGYLIAGAWTVLAAMLTAHVKGWLGIRR